MQQPPRQAVPNPPRRSVLAGGAGAALGISTLALPTAAGAASPGSSGSSQSWVDTGSFSAGTTGTVYGVTFDGTRFIVGGSSGKYYYSDGTDTSSWTTVQTSMDDDGYHLASDGSTLVVAEENDGNLYRVANAFSASPTGVQEISTDAVFLTYVSGGPDGRSAFVTGLGTLKDLYYSTDGGDNWSRNANQPFNGSSFLYGLATDGDVYYALGGDAATLRQSTSLSSSWTNMNPTGLPAGARHLAFDGSSTLVVVAAVDGDADTVPYRSTDGGQTWSAASTAISGAYQCVLHAGGSTFVALGAPGGNVSGTRANAIRSTDGGVTWTDLSTGDLSDTFSSRASAAFGGGRIVASTGDKVLVHVV